MIGFPELKPHDLRHGVAMEVLERHHDLEQVRALLGHARLDTTQIYTSIRPAQLKRAVSFYEEKGEVGSEPEVVGHPRLNLLPLPFESSLPPAGRQAEYES